jgi:hypothetical protein
MTDTPAPAAPPASAAAFELFGDRPTPTEAPASFLNPSAGNYVDQAGSLRYHRSTEQLAQDRADWIAGFDRAARAAAFAKEDMTPYSAEARQARIEARQSRRRGWLQARRTAVCCRAAACGHQYDPLEREGERLSR